MPYVLDTITSRDRPKAASQAAKTNRIMGIILAKVKCEFRIIKVAMMNRDNIIPSRHRRDDIRWDRYINNPVRDTAKAIIMFINTRDIW